MEIWCFQKVHQNNLSRICFVLECVRGCDVVGCRGGTTVEPGISWIRGTVQYRKWSPTANDPETANDPQNGLQMILDRKWSPKLTANDPVKTSGMEWILWNWFQKRTDYKKGTFFSRLLKKKGRRTLHLRSIYTRPKNWKWNKSEKDMVSTVYFFLCQLLQFSLKNCFVAENLRQAGRYAEKTLLF